MDRKTTIVLAASFGLLLLWPVLVTKLYPPIKLPPRTNTVATITNAPGTAPVPTLSAVTNGTVLEAAPLVTSTAQEELLVIENATGRYTLTSHGGGLKTIELKEYPQSVDCSAEKSSLSNRLVSLNSGASVPALALLGGESVQGDGVYRLVRTETGARAEKRLTNGLAIIKDFRLGSNYFVIARTWITNTSASSVLVPPQEWVAGTAGAMSPQETSFQMGSYWYDGKTVEHVDSTWFANKSFGCFPGTARFLYSGGTGSNVFWVAAHNQFFVLALVPTERAAQALVVQTNLPPLSAEELKNNPRATPTLGGFRASLAYPAALLGAGQSVAHEFQLYAGPKEYNSLARIAGRADNKFDGLMGFDAGFAGTFFGFFAKLLLLSMNKLHSWSLPYGLAIIIITVIIKALFWPLTNASTKSMKRMAALQPQMKALQEKYKADPAKMQRKLMEFMKEHKVSPLGGCLPMMLQIPVFFGFFKMVQTAIELRGAHFLWACDLSRPDTIFFLPVLGFPVNPMPLMMGATMLWQARLTPASPGMDPMQQKIMRYMPLMFLAFLYNYSAGLTLYWTVQNLLSIAQMKLTRAKDQTVAPGTPPANAPIVPRRKQK